jgi:hypothetical protein
MENTGFKGLLVTLFQRVILSYKTTLVGIALIAVPYCIDFMTASPNPALHTIGMAAGAIFLLIKEKLPKAPPPDVKVPAGIMILALALGFGLSGCSLLKGSTFSGTWSGPTNSADVTVVTPAGGSFHATLNSAQACLASANLVAIPGTNIQCASACGSISQVAADGKTATLTLMCQVVGGVGGLFPFSFSVNL